MGFSGNITKELVFFVNGRKVVEKSPDPSMSLIVYLRTKLGLTGTKLACGEGGCGACTVMVSSYSPDLDGVTHNSVNACLTPLCSLHGLAVTTVEGIGNVDNIHPVQERLALFHGSQCGFCTPGFVMSMYTLLRNNPEPSIDHVKDAFDGNLCRCTGYRPILDAYRTFTKNYVCSMGEQCCQNASNKTDGKLKAQTLNPRFEDLKPYNPNQEPIFPPELKVRYNDFHSDDIKFEHSGRTWYRPANLNSLLEIKAQFPKAKIIVGNTELGVDAKLRNWDYDLLIQSSHIKELTVIKACESGVIVGAAVRLSKLSSVLKGFKRTLPEEKTRIFAAVVEMLKWFAGNQIRNVASLAGNLMTASPISDLVPLMTAAAATLTLSSKERGERSIKLSKDFFLGYRKLDMKEDEVLISVTIPYSKQNEYFLGYKQANRKDDDISIVNAGLRVVLSESKTVDDVSLAFGGMAPTVVVATKTMQLLSGKLWNEDILDKALDTLAEDLPLAPGSPGGVAEYRRTLALSFFFKFYLSVSQKISCNGPTIDLSAVTELEKPESKTSQVFSERSLTRGELEDTVGKPVPHFSALQQSTGEAVYVDDMVPATNELHLALVMSSKSHAKILSVDPSEALKVPDVVDYLSASSVQGRNYIGLALPVSETVFASETVTSQGQAIGAIVAETQAAARKAASLVKVEYQELQPIITIRDAIKAKSYYGEPLVHKFGDVVNALSESDHVIQGEMQLNGQEHFYLETMNTRAVPGERGEMEVFLTTQDASEAQILLAQVLGVSTNKVSVRTKRLGGGFGGKNMQALFSAAPTVVAARKYNRPVRCSLDRDVDMVSTGTRHPYLGKYKVGYMDNGDILAMDIELYANSGHVLELSEEVLKEAMVQVFMCYRAPHMRCTGYCCKTNIMSNTAFRGFGAPQASLIVEAAVDQVASTLGRNTVELREQNLWKDTDICHYEKTPSESQLSKVWGMCMKVSEYKQRLACVERYNQENKWKKKGIAIVPVKYGVSFPQKFLNKAGALVHVYRDGSVLLAHGGIEMGQGLNIKMIQVASEILHIPTSKIHIMETGTNTVPNSSPTAASSGTDLNGMAVQIACEKLWERLKPYRNEKPNDSWEEWVVAAYLDCANLSSAGFYNRPNFHWDFENQSGRPYVYYTYAAGCTEVQIDCLTGDHTILRADIVVDAGQSINPAIDIGQIEGAYVQGCGLFLLEELKLRPDGTLLTRGPGNYKIPAVGNIPADFNVHLVPDSKNTCNVFSSKGVGEPPLLTAKSAYFAVKEAVRAARKQAGESEIFDLPSPATPARIRMACPDFISKKFPEAETGTYKPWFVDL